MLEVSIDGDLGSAASVAEGRFEGDHGLFRGTAHTTEVGGGEVPRFAAKLLQGFEADQAPAKNGVEGGEDARTPAGFRIRDEVSLREGVTQEVEDSQEDPIGGRG